MIDIIGLGAEFTFLNNGSSNIQQALNDVNDLYKGIQSGQDVMSTMSAQFDSFNQNLLKGGVKTALQGIAMTMGTIKGITTAADFQEAFTGMTKFMSDDSASGQAKFNQELSQTARYLGETKESVMDATTAYMQMGLEQEKALEMAKKVKYAGKIWDVDGATAAQSFQSISAAYNMDFVNDDEITNQFIDMVNTVSDSTAAQGKDILSFLESAGSGLKLIGRTSMEQAMGMAAAGRKAQVDIGHFGYAMRSISKNYVEKGEESFGKLGVSVKDSTGQLRSMADVLGDLAAVKDTFSADQMTEWAMSMGGMYSDDLLRMLGGWSEYQKVMEIIASGDYEGSAAKEWTKMTNTFNYNINQTKVILKDFVQSIFGNLLPMLTKGVQAINFVLGQMVEWFSKHPIISKFVVSLWAISGVALIVVGAGMIMVAMLNKLSASIAAGVFSLTTFRNSMVVLRTSIASTLPALATFGLRMVGLSVAFGAVYLAWKYDILGIKSLLTNFQETVKNSMNQSQRLMKLSAEDMRVELDNIEGSNNFGDFLTGAFTRIGIAWQALCDLWDDYTISDELYEKLVASGMEPIVTTIMMIIMRFRQFWKGFTEGFSEGINIVKDVIHNVLAPPFIWLSEHVFVPFLKILGQIGYAIGIFSKETVQGLDPAMTAWEKFGQITGMLVGIGTAIAVVVKVVGIISTIGSAFGTLFGWIGSFGSMLFNGMISPLMSLAGTILSSFTSSLGVVVRFGSTLVSVAGTILGVIGTVVTGILAAFGIVVTAPAWVVGAITVAVASAIGLIYHFRDEIYNGLVYVWDVVSNAVSNAFSGIVSYISGFIDSLRDKFSWFNDFCSFMSEIGSNISDAFNTAIEVVSNVWNQIVDLVKTSVDHIIADFAPIKETISNVWGGMVEKATSTWETITGALTGFVDGVKDTFGGMFDSISSLFESVWSVIGGPMSQFADGCSTIFNDIITGIQNFAGDIVNGLLIIYGAVTSFLSPIVEVIGSMIQGAISIIWGGFQLIYDFVSMSLGLLFNTIANLLGTIWSFVCDVVGTIFTTVIGIVQGGIDVVTGIIQVIVGVVTTVFGAIIAIVSGDVEGAKQIVINGWNTIWSGLCSIVQGIWDAVSSAFNGIVSTLSSLGGSILEAITSPFRGAMEYIGNFIADCANVGGKIIDTIVGGIKGAAGNLYDAVTGVFSSVESKLFPHSDAKEGPFSQLTFTGTRIPLTIGEGVAKAGSDLYAGISAMSNNAMNEMNPLLQDKSFNVSANYVTSTADDAGLSDANVLNSMSKDIVDSSSMKSYFNVDDSSKNYLNSAIDALTKAISSLTERIGSVTGGGSDSISQPQIVISEGAIQINLGSGDSNPNGIQKAIPMLKEEFRKMLVDTIKEIKDDGYY